MSLTKKILIGVGALVALIVIIAVASSGHGTKTVNTATTPKASTSAPPAPTTQAPPPTTQAPPPPPSTPSMTLAEQQAVDSAQSYLSDGQGFSYQGLLTQLTSSSGEGETTSDAQFAINYLHPNWDQQAVESAKNYLSDGQGFSRASLIQQLTSSSGEGFTYDQAVYAVNQVGL